MYKAMNLKSVVCLSLYWLSLSKKKGKKDKIEF